MATEDLRDLPTRIEHAIERLRLMVFADYGIGKTTLAMTFPKPLVIDTDGGLVSVTHLHPGEDLGQRWVMPLEKEDGGALTPHGQLEALIRHVLKDPDSFETLVIDSFDEMNFILLDELVMKGAEYDRSHNKDTHPVAEFIPEQAEYLANQRQIHSFLHTMRQLGKHVVLTSGVLVKVGEKRRPDLPPGLMKVTGRWASVMGELIVADEGNRVLLVKNGDPDRTSKTRFGALEPMVVDPTFDVLWAAAQADAKKGK